MLANLFIFIDAYNSLISFIIRRHQLFSLQLIFFLMHENTIKTQEPNLKQKKKIFSLLLFIVMKTIV